MINAERCLLMASFNLLKNGQLYTCYADAKYMLPVAG